MRRMLLLVVPIVAAVAGAWWLHGRRMQPQRVPVQPSVKFRAYLAEPGVHLVVYSPPAGLDAAATTAALRLLRQKFDGVVLYGCTSQTVALVQAAHALGYRAVLLTVWDPRSEPELAIASSLVRDYAGSMTMAVSLGSEGLMQQRYTVADLQAARDELLDRNTQSTSVEMTTVEPWWLFLRGDAQVLRGFGEFTSVNVHVVWDTDIVSPGPAAQWTRDRAAEVQAALGRPLLLREAGMPGGGSSPRETAHLQFNRELQAGFWRAWLLLPGRPATAVFEGVDNGEKHWRGFEGSWGLLSEDGRPWPAWKAFPMAGPQPPAAAPSTPR